EDRHLDALTSVESRVAELVTGGRNRPPEAAAPVADSGDLPAADNGVGGSTPVRGETLAVADRQVIDEVVADPMRRDFGRVEVDHLEPVRVGEVRRAPELGIGRHLTALRSRVDADVAARESTHVRSRERAVVGVEPLERDAVREAALELDLTGVAVRIA